MGEINTARNENEQGGFNKQSKPIFLPSPAIISPNQSTYIQIWKQANIFFSCGVNNEAYVDAAV